ncbi:hypothetical protein [Desulfurispora thermophila]|uniref:hypothetical protein n=1 Tax=Desulfurispora thermophila TaxID=265470 RepID=UPI00037C5125|nr:hypothetical protein [Desulfurispora thermophila]
MVNNQPDRQLGDVLAKMLHRVEEIRQEREKSLQQTREAVQVLGRMSGILTELENQKKQEAMLARQLDQVTQRLARSSKAWTDRPKSSVNLKQIIGGIKATGQIIETVAGSFQNMIDSVGSIVSSMGVGAGARTVRSVEAKNSGLDLGGIINTMQGLVQSLAVSQTKAGQVQEEKQELGEISKGDGISTPPVVKAVPVTKEEA